MYTKIVEVPNLSLNGEDTVSLCMPAFNPYTK